MSDERSPRDLGALFDLGGQAIRAEVYTALPGRVEAYDQAEQKASVQPLLRRAYVNDEDVRVVETLPVIHGVPVMFQSAGECSMSFPVRKGTSVLLLFAHGSLDRWLSKGGLVDPEDDRKHDLNDAVAIPGLRPFSDPIPADGLHDTAMVLRAPAVHVGEADLAATDEVVHGTGIDPFTGSTYKALGSTASSLRARK